MKRCELRFINGVAAGRAIEAESFHPVVWLCAGKDGRKWWTFKEPLWWEIEAEYTIAGIAPRKSERWVGFYGLVGADEMGRRR